MKKTLPIIIVIVALVAGAAFYGGMKYQASKNPTRGQFANFSGADRQLMGAGVRVGSVGKNNLGFINGEIISKDDQSITVKMRAGGSKIIFYSANTAIGKTASGTAEDLLVGASVMATGQTSTDGSLTAETIQIRNGQEPLGPGAMMAPQQ